MYATCIFCNHALGHNEAIEHFPVGRKLAFDAARGRLWVVCPSCSRWNLTPLESRWEAIDEAERAYRDTKLRASTENIGLAKLKEGTELIRIGKPMLPEFAAWRYSDVFKRRHWRAQAAMYGSTVMSVVLPLANLTYVKAHLAGMIAMGASLAYSTYSLGGLAWNVVQANRRRLVIPVPGRRVWLSATHANNSKVLTARLDGTWRLRLLHARPFGSGRIAQNLLHGAMTATDPGWTDLEGDDARRAIGRLMPLVNVKGGAPTIVQDSVRILSDESDPTRRLGVAPAYTFTGSHSERELRWIDPALRLAMEMSLHESDERRALEGELAELEDRWREAEEIANIADNMFLPTSVGSELERLRQARDGDQLTSTDKN